MYLFLGYAPRTLSHFKPHAIFAGNPGGARRSVLLLAAWLSFTVAVALNTSFWLVTMYYYVPVVVFASWLVVTTFLHHNDLEVRRAWRA